MYKVYIACHHGTFAAINLAGQFIMEVAYELDVDFLVFRHIFRNWGGKRNGSATRCVTL